MTTPVIAPPVAAPRAVASRADRQGAESGKGEEFTAALVSAVESETSDTPKQSKDTTDPADKSVVQAAIDSAVVAMAATIPTGTPTASPTVVTAPEAATGIVAITPAQDPGNFSEVAARAAR